jgi:hypothetical protein
VPAITMRERVAGSLMLRPDAPSTPALTRGWSD